MDNRPPRRDASEVRPLAKRADAVVRTVEDLSILRLKPFRIQGIRKVEKVNR